jgi:hypothetical protein
MMNTKRAAKVRKLASKRATSKSLTGGMELPELHGPDHHTFDAFSTIWVSAGREISKSSQFTGDVSEAATPMGCHLNHQPTCVRL